MGTKTMTHLITVVERAVSKLVMKHGFRRAGVRYEDEDGEPFTVYIILQYSPHHYDKDVA